jgi:hypothetical protein
MFGQRVSIVLVWQKIAGGIGDFAEFRSESCVMTPGVFVRRSDPARYSRSWKASQNEKA